MDLEPSSSPIQNLPPPVIRSIQKFLPAVDLASSEQVNKIFAAALQNQPLVWQAVARDLKINVPAGQDSKQAIQHHYHRINQNFRTFYDNIPFFSQYGNKLYGDPLPGGEAHPAMHRMATKTIDFFKRSINKIPLLRYVVEPSLEPPQKTAQMSPLT